LNEIDSYAKKYSAEMAKMPGETEHEFRAKCYLYACMGFINREHSRLTTTDGDTPKALVEVTDLTKLRNEIR
jgi:hypothetical protein